MRCTTLLGGHTWEKWQLVETLIKDLRIGENNTVNTSFTLGVGQVRRCVTCKLTEVKRLPADFVLKKTPATAQEAGGPQSTTNNDDKETNQT